MLGSVVLSVAGRDKDKYFIVVKVIDDSFVMIADGESHLLEKPKKKRRKHIKPIGVVIEKLADKFAESMTVYDAEIRSNLKPYSKKEVTDGEG